MGLCRTTLSVFIILVMFLDLGEAATSSQDAKALQALRRGIQDPFSKLENWQGNDPCGDQWEGIICAPDAEGLSHVTEIHLLSLNLSGILDSEVGSMIDLQQLDLMFNNFSGTIPSSLGNLESLEFLMLNGNSFSGQLPSEIGNLTKLKRLQVDQNQLTGSLPQSLTNLKNVKHLHLNNNSFSGTIPIGFGNLQFIHLLLDNNNLSGQLPADIVNNSALQILQLDNNPFIVQELPTSYTTSLSQLLKLSLRNCSLQGQLPDFSGLTKLQVLDMSHNNFSGEIPKINLTSATTIDFSNNVLFGDIPEELLGPNLELLSLENNGLNGSVDPITTKLQEMTRRTDSFLILNFQYNSLPSSSVVLPRGVDMWLYGNAQICIDNMQLCSPKSADDLPDHDSLDSSNINNCPEDICNPEIDEIVPSLAVEGQCKCASPIQILLFLRSPGFRFFGPHVRKFEDYMSDELAVQHLSVSSFNWTSGRLILRLKVFPEMTTNNRRFNQTEVRRIYEEFTGWKIPDLPLFGPKELIRFDPPFGIDLYVGAIRHLKKKYVYHVLVIVLGLLFGLLGLIAIAASVLLYVRRKRKETLKKRRKNHVNFKVEGIKCFSWQQLDRATNSFHENNQIGQGGYGKVYKGVLEDGTVVAIKRAEEVSHNGANEFYTEIQLLSRVHHRNLVSLIGYFADDKEQMLVYEFMSGGTLRDHLSSPQPLNFQTRLTIALGAARGILYLHTEADPPIFHRDIKATNILLDDSNTPKVADFGLSKLAPAPDINGVSGHVSTVVKGTPGYLDPEYFLTHKLTDKSDVYSFGVVLLELLSGLQPISQGKNIVREARSFFDTGMILHMVDPRMGAVASELIEPFIRLALSCSSDDPGSRPSMSEIVRELDALRREVANKSVKSTPQDLEAAAAEKQVEPASPDNNDERQCIGLVLPR